MLRPVGSEPSGNPSDVFSVAGEATPGGAAAKRESAGSGATPSRGSGHSLGPDGLGGSGAINIEHAGDQIGPYTLLSVIAEGGFGVVWLAERLQPYQQRVAIKIVKAGMDSRQVLSRFERERQTLAILEHPGIARVIDGGLTQQGRPYFVMEYVSGSSVTEFCDQHSLGLRARLGLFAQICRVVHAAHVKGVIHRDLKPANILVEGDADRARPRIIDFGMARVVSQQSELFAQSEQVVLAGTLEYMSPEQAKLETGIDTRSDVYALGVILHELLIGELPLASSMLRSVPLDQARSMLGNATARRPSEKLRAMTPERAARVAQRRVTSVRELGDRLRRELDLIVAMATRPERDRRYQSALALAEDIERYLAGEALIAAPDSAIYRIGKLVRRNRLAFGAAAALLMALIGGLVGTSVALQVAINAKAEADTAREATSEALQVVIRAKAEADSAREATKEALDRARSTLYASRVSAAAGELQAGRAVAAIARLERCEPEQKASWEWRMLRAQTDTSIATIGDFQQAPVELKCSPDGAILFWGGSQGEGYLVDAISGAVLAELPPLGERTTQAVFSGDGRLLAVSGIQGLLRMYRVLDDAGRFAPAVLTELKRPEDDTLIYRDLIFTRDGKRLFAGGSLGKLVILNVPDLVELHRFDVGKGSLRMTQMSDDERSVYAVNSLGVLFRFDTDSGAELGPEGGQPLPIRISAAVMDRQSQRIIIGGAPTGLALWDPRDGHVPLIKDRVLFRDLAISTGGKYVAAIGQDRVVRFALVEDLLRASQREAALGGLNQEVARFMQRDELDGTPAKVAFSPDGTLLAVGSQEGTVRLYSVPEFRRISTLVGHTGSVSQIVFVPGSPLLFTAGGDQRLKLWTTRTPADKLVGAVERRRPTAVEFTDPSTLVIGFNNGEVETWDARLQRRRSVDAAHPAEIVSLVSRGDGTLISTDKSGNMSLWRGMNALLQTTADTGQSGGRMNTWPGIDRETGLGCIAISNTAIQLIQFGERSFEFTRRLELPSDVVLRKGLAVLAGGATLAAIRYDESRANVALVDTASGKIVGELKGHESDVFAVAPSPDGRMVATGSKDSTVRIWDAASWKMLALLRGHSNAVRSVVWLPGSNRVVSGGNDPSIRVWDPLSGHEICVASSVDSVVMQLVASPDERLVAVLTVNSVKVIDSSPVPLRLAEQLRGDKSPKAVEAVVAFSEDDWRTPSRSRVAALAADPSSFDQLALACALHAGGWFGTPVISRHTVRPSLSTRKSNFVQVAADAPARPFEKPAKPDEPPATEP